MITIIVTKTASSTGAWYRRKGPQTSSRSSLFQSAELLAFRQLGQHEIGSRTHVELLNENDLITKALVGAELRLIARARILEAVLSFVVVAEDFRPRRHHEHLLIVTKSPNCRREVFRDRQTRLRQTAELIDNPSAKER